MEKELITGKIIACAFKVHNTLGAGFLEKVYERALVPQSRSNENIVFAKNTLILSIL